MADVVFTTIGQTITKEYNARYYQQSSWVEYIKFLSSFKLNSINETNLTANVTITFDLKTQYLHWDSSWNFKYSILVDGVEKASKTTSSGGTGVNSSGVAKKGPKTTSLTSWTGDIPYNSDGTLTAEIGFKSYNSKTASYTPPNTTKTYTVELPSVARASTFTLSGSALGSAVTVTIDRQLDTFTHKVEYSFAGSSYKTETSSATTSFSFTPALSLATNIPNATSGVLTVRVTTLNGTTQIGSPATQTLTLSLPASVVPTITSLTATHNSNNTTVKGWGIYVKGYSTATLTINGADGAQGSTIKSYSISGGGFSSSSSSFTTGILNTSGSITFTATITDSRGRTASKTTSITVYDYFKPSISVNAFRCNSSGTATDAGTYLRVTATYNYATVNSKNTISRSVSCNSVSNTKFTSGTAFTLAANAAVASNYTLTATISDTLGGSATATASIPNTAALPLHIKGNKKGIGLGTTASTDSTVEIGWPIDLNGNKIEGLLDLVYPVGAIYMSVNSTSPATLFGGTWAALGGQFLLAASSTYTAGSTGGAASTTLTTANLPSHTHSVGAHAHGLNSHTHGVGTLAAASTSLTGRATFRDVNVSSSDLMVGTINGVFSYTTSSWSGEHWAMNGSSASGYKYQHLDFNGTHAHTVSGATAAASGSTANSTAFNSGATGSGSSFTNLPPYLAVYMWKRTA